MIDPTSRLPDLSLELGPTLSLDLPTVTRAVKDSLVTLLGDNGGRARKGIVRSEDEMYYCTMIPYDSAEVMV